MDLNESVAAMLDKQSFPPDTEIALRTLRDNLKGYESLVVAFSGGVDSAFLAYAARQVLGDRMIALLGISGSLAGDEEQEAVRFLESHQIPYERIETEEMKIDGYQENGPDRCYFCKGELFAKLGRFAETHGFARVAHGANLDDRSDHRPGSRAAREQNVVAPLEEAGFTKAMIREAARILNLSVWDKPAAPCLASRIPYFSQVTDNKLGQIERAERVLKERGYSVCRVRHHGEIARIELPLADRRSLVEGNEWPEVVAAIKQAGFKYVTLDLEDFQSGRLNEVLKEL
jgi:uncharacterized protein